MDVRVGLQRQLSTKERYFWTVVLVKTLESPLDCKEIQPVHPKGNQPWIFIGRTDAEAETPILWLPDAKSQLIGKDPDAGKDWRQEEKRTEDEMVGWHEDVSLSKLREMVKDRKAWHAAVHEVTKSNWTTILRATLRVKYYYYCDPILQIHKLRQRGEAIAQGHTTSKWQRQDLNSGLKSPSCWSGLTGCGNKGQELRRPEAPGTTTWYIIESVNASNKSHLLLNTAGSTTSSRGVRTRTRVPTGISKEGARKDLF